MATPRSGTWRVDVLAYPGCFGTEVFAVIDVLAIANAVSAALRPGTPPPVRTRIVSVRGGRGSLSGGALVETERAGPIGVDTDQLVVPGFEFFYPATMDDLLAGWSAEVAYLARFADTTTSLASVCGGAFLLAQAGLLNGHRATTSWFVAPEL